MILRRWTLPWPLHGHWQTDDGTKVASVQDSANRKNLLLLVMLRWLAVCGQVATIVIVQRWFGIPLPVRQMGVVILLLIALNLLSLYRCRGRSVITGTELFFGLLMDVAALTVQLYLSGGGMNPFVSLFLLQVILGAVLLRPLASWTLVVVTSFCFLLLTRWYRDLDLTAYGYQPDYAQPPYFGLHIDGMFICFVLVAVLLVWFMTRVIQNLRDRDRRLSELRQHTAEEGHIVRMGLLASGAAHEFGTPLATLSVILNDWEHMPALRADPALHTEIGEMRTALDRCKDIVSRILLAAGEARGENFQPTTLRGFLDDVVTTWCETRGPACLDYIADIPTETTIVSDTVIGQVLLNVLDNALEASPGWVGMDAVRKGDRLVVTVRDRGPGFKSEILANLGKPYHSTKRRSGSGLGLFLVVNVLRKLGGTVIARNNRDGGASVEVTLPIGALSIEDETADTEMTDAVG